MVEALSDKFNLSEEDKGQTIKSGGSLFRGRITWALTFLYNAGLLERPSRGIYSISEIGKEALKQYPSRIDVKTLKQYPKFIEWFSKERKQTNSSSDVVEIDVESTQTPLEILEKGYEQLVAVTQQELLDRIIDSPPDVLEQIILDLLMAMGYGDLQKGATRMGNAYTPDGGIDGVIKEDALGLSNIYVQAKRYKKDNAIAVSQVREFVGSLSEKRANKGVFVTTSYFSKDVYKYVSNVQHTIILIDGDELAKLLYKHSVGVRLENSYHINKIDENYFSD
jgi:restriction system protein